MLKYTMILVSCIILSAYAAVGWGFSHEVTSAGDIRVNNGNGAEYVDMVPIKMACAVRAAFWSVPVTAFEAKLEKVDAYLVYRVGILQDGHKTDNVRVDATNSKVLKH